MKCKQIAKFFITSDSKKNILHFLPMKWLFIGYIGITVTYICTVTGLPEQRDLKYVYEALEFHPFLTDTLKGFLALTAVVIAWHRSIATEHQIELQTNSNRISQYYDFKNHLTSHLENHIEIDPEILFSRLFNDPKNADYSPSKELKSFTNAIIENLESNDINSAESEFNKMSSYFQYYEHEKIITHNTIKKTKISKFNNLSFFITKTANSLPLSKSESKEFNSLNTKTLLAVNSFIIRNAQKKKLHKQ